MAGTALTWIDDRSPLPPTQQALGPGSDAPGLLAAGGSVTPQRLEEAYQRGIFPWFSPGDPPLAPMALCSSARACTWWWWLEWQCCSSVFMCCGSVVAVF